MKRGSRFVVAYCGEVEVFENDVVDCSGGTEGEGDGCMDMRSISCCNRSRSNVAWPPAEVALFCSI